MHYSLIDRFQGGLIGSDLGEALANNLVAYETHKSPEQAFWQPDRLVPRTERNQFSPSIAAQLRTKIIEKLINNEQLKAEDWRNLGIRYQQTATGEERLDTCKAALLSLPLYLYYYNSFELLEQQLILAIESWQESEVSLKDLCLWHEAIALALKEKLTPNPLAQLIHRAQSLDSPLGEQLERIQTFLSEGTSLERVVATLKQPKRSGQMSTKERSRTAIALAIYCFASTPEDFGLAVTRAWRTGYRVGTTAALTGAIAGVCNSVNGIPLTWLLSAGDRSMVQERKRQAKLLFGSWAGVMQLENASMLEEEAIAAASLIQSRSLLKIISQNE
jgi:ADP-ribosylglycohydrolase